jgi:hypothetical protein
MPAARSFAAIRSPIFFTSHPNSKVLFPCRSKPCASFSVQLSSLFSEAAACECRAFISSRRGLMAEATNLCIAVLEAAVLSFIADRITLLNSPNQLRALLSIWRCKFSAVRATKARGRRARGHRARGAARGHSRVLGHTRDDRDDRLRRANGEDRLDHHNNSHNPPLEA